MVTGASPNRYLVRTLPGFGTIMLRILLALVKRETRRGDQLPATALLFRLTFQLANLSVPVPVALLSFVLS